MGRGTKGFWDRQHGGIRESIFIKYNMASNIDSRGSNMITEVTFVMRTIPDKDTRKRSKINFMMIVGSKKGITKATNFFKKTIIRRTFVK
uniref:Retrofit n=1 Tax=Solanum tuberosum TaxID=4113 RepID=M1CY14_SOLTU